LFKPIARTGDNQSKVSPCATNENRVQEKFHFGKHANDKWFNSQGEVVCANVFNLEELPRGLQESIKANLQFYG